LDCFELRYESAEKSNARVLIESRPLIADRWICVSARISVLKRAIRIVEDTRLKEPHMTPTDGCAPMAVLMIAEQSNLDEETYASMLQQLTPLLRAANGFISHTGGPSPAGGIRIIETWESEVDSRNFFNDNLKPNLPPGVLPDLTYYELHAAFTR
jgi:hypothetical protein